MQAITGCTIQSSTIATVVVKDLGEAGVVEEKIVANSKYFMKEILLLMS